MIIISRYDEIKEIVDKVPKCKVHLWALVTHQRRSQNPEKVMHIKETTGSSNGSLPLRPFLNGNFS